MPNVQGRPVPRPGSVWLSDGAGAVCRPLGHNAVRLHPGSWLGTWQALNRAATIPHCLSQLAETGSRRVPHVATVCEAFVVKRQHLGDTAVLREGCRSCAFGFFGFAGQVAHDLDVGPQRQAVP